MPLMQILKAHQIVKTQKQTNIKNDVFGLTNIGYEFF